MYDSAAGANLESRSKFSQWLDRFAYSADGANRSWPRGKIGDLLVCPFCIGFHISWVLACLWLWVWPWQIPLTGWIAVWGLAGAQSLLNSVERKLR